MDELSKQKEYWRNVSSQEELPYAGTQETFELASLEKLFLSLSKVKSEDRPRYVKEALLANPSLFHKFRLFVGVSNKRAYLDLSYIFRKTPHPTKNSSLCGCPIDDFYAHEVNFFLNFLKNIKSEEKTANMAAEVITKYLNEKGLNKILSIFAELKPEERLEVIQRVILPHEFQQSEAKRRGHGAEAIFAKIVESLGCKILPKNKSTNPMGEKDIRLNKKTFAIEERNFEGSRSYDMVILDQKETIRVGAICLIHSSDPGEYGVAKSSRTMEYKNEMTSYNGKKDKSQKLFLCSLVDGTGFAENKKDTINVILKNVDCFVQIKTLYKIGLFLHELGLCKVKAIKFNAEFYSKEEINYFKTHYIPKDIKFLGSDEKPNKDWKLVQAGKAELFI
jgi:hypothetical protein